MNRFKQNGISFNIKKNNMDNSLSTKSTHTYNSVESIYCVCVWHAQLLSDLVHQLDTNVCEHSSPIVEQLNKTCFLMCCQLLVFKLYYIGAD